MSKFRVLSLFAGIGGFDLGLERTGGFETVAFCEINPFCRRVLAKHWPKVPCYEDVRTLTADALRRDGIAVDVICGGFPCQDVSVAGKRAGLAGERSGLWSEYRRIVGELRPRFIIIENVPGLLSAGAGDVLRDLAALRYDVVWECIPASAVGAPHRRDRFWAIAYSNDKGLEGRERSELRKRPSEWTARPSSPSMANAECFGQPPTRDDALNCAQDKAWEADRIRSGGETLADTESVAGDVEGQTRSRGSPEAGGRDRGSASVQWIFEPDVGRVANGVPARVDRLKALGNAVVPQIPEIIGRAILEAVA